MIMTLRFCLFATFLWTLAACSANRDPAPVTKKADGKVTYKDGKAYTKGGTIEFRHETKAGVTSISGIDEEGKFSLYSMTAQHKVPGVEEGTYQVTITPNSSDQNVQPIVLKKKYQITDGQTGIVVHADD